MNADEPRSGWARFWFEPQSTAPLTLFRIAFGVLATAWTLSLFPDLGHFFQPDGLFPQASNRGWVWTIFDVIGDDEAAVHAVWAVLLVASVLLTIGLGTRVAAVLVFVGILSFERQNDWVFNAGDVLIRNLSFFLLLAPAGAAVSLDRLRRHRDDFWEFPLRAPWALRLLQIQVSVVYIGTVWAKLRGNTWNNGTAVSYALRIGDLVRVKAPEFLTDSLLLSNLLTFGTLAVEASLGVLVWNRRARPWVLALGVLLHLGIELTLDVGFFSWAMLALYLVFVPAAAAERLLLRLRRGAPEPARRPVKGRTPTTARA